MKGEITLPKGFSIDAGDIQVSFGIGTDDDKNSAACYIGTRVTPQALLDETRTIHLWPFWVWEAKRFWKRIDRTWLGLAGTIEANITRPTKGLIWFEKEPNNRVGWIRADTKEGVLAIERMVPKLFRLTLGYLTDSGRTCEAILAENQDSFFDGRLIMFRLRPDCQCWSGSLGEYLKQEEQSTA